MPLDVISKLSRLLLASVAEQADGSLTWSQIFDDKYSYDVSHIDSCTQKKVNLTWSAVVRTGTRKNNYR